MKGLFYALALGLTLGFCFTNLAHADNTVTVEIGWRFDNSGFKRNTIDFGAVRFNNDGREVHVATWDNTYTAGIGYVLGHDRTDNGYVTFTPGLAYTTGDAPLRLFTRAAVGYTDSDVAVEAAHNAYIPLLERDVASDAFATLGLSYIDRDNDNDSKSNNSEGSGSDSNGDSDSANDDDDTGGDGGGSDAACKPGYGYGDTNHCHSGPPGQL